MAPERRVSDVCHHHLGDLLLTAPVGTERFRSHKKRNHPRLQNYSACGRRLRRGNLSAARFYYWRAFYPKICPHAGFVFLADARGYIKDWQLAFRICSDGKSVNKGLYFFGNIFFFFVLCGSVSANRNI